MHPILLAIETGLDQTARTAFGSLPATTDIPTRVGQIIGIALSLIGVIFLVLMVYGGFLWMSSAGEAEKVKKAKGMITNAVIGLVIVVAAYTITNFVLKSILSQ